LSAGQADRALEADIWSAATSLNSRLSRRGDEAGFRIATRGGALATPADPMVVGRRRTAVFGNSTYLKTRCKLRLL
jgi:hypothetical protein